MRRMTLTLSQIDLEKSLREIEPIPRLREWIELLREVRADRPIPQILESELRSTNLLAFLVILNAIIHNQKTAANRFLQ